MSLQPLDQEQVQSTAQVLLSYLEDGSNRTPNNMLEGIVSGKSLLRGILSGQLLICTKAAGIPAPPAPSAEADVENTDADPAEE